MPLYDPDNPLAEDAPTLAAVADLLAEAPGAQVLALGRNAPGTAEEKKAKTLEHITIGPHKRTWSDDDVTVADILREGAQFQLYAPLQGGKTLVVNGLDVDAAGEFGLITRMPFDEHALVDKTDCYLFFLDCLSSIENHLANWFNHETPDGVRNTPRISAPVRQVGPAWGPQKEYSAQGEYMHAMDSIAWGDQLGEVG